MPTFCRHGRFLERCPICSKDLPGRAPSGGATRRPSGASRAGTSAEPRAQKRTRTAGLRVRREGRAVEDGYSSELVPGLRASADATRLAEEIAFASGRLAQLAIEPPGLYGEARALAVDDLERATWICFLIAYLGPLQDDEDPFMGVRTLLARAPDLAYAQMPDADIDLDGIALGPRTSHDPARGSATLRAYGEWVQRGGRPAASSSAAETSSGPQASAFTGEVDWSPERRFERLFERLALPGLHRRGRFDLLVTMGRLGLYEVQPASLHLSAARGSEDPTTTAAKRVFGIGDPLLLERRAATLASAASVPIEVLDLALDNWASPERASMGATADVVDAGALERASLTLAL